MAIVTSQRQASSEEIVAEMDRRGLAIQQLEELRDRLCDDIKTLRDDVEMEKRVREEWRQRCEWAEQRAEAAEKALALLVADVADYPAWQRPCHALDVARDHLAKHAGGDNG